MLLLRLIFDDLHPLYTLLLDLVEAIYLGKQGVVHVRIRESPVELLGPLLQRQASLQFEGLFVDYPVNVVRLEELDTEPLPPLESLVWDDTFFRLSQARDER